MRPDRIAKIACRRDCRPDEEVGKDRADRKDGDRALERGEVRHPWLKDGSCRLCQNPSNSNSPSDRFRQRSATSDYASYRSLLADLGLNSKSKVDREKPRYRFVEKSFNPGCGAGHGGNRNWALFIAAPPAV